MVAKSEPDPAGRKPQVQFNDIKSRRSWISQSR